jgi:Domain of unknown function (DUF4440)
MRRAMWTIVAVIVTTVSSPSRVGGSNDDTELLKTRETVWHSYFINDTKSLQELLPTDTIAINSGSGHWDNQADILHDASDFQSKGGRLIRLEFPRTEIRHYGDVAIIYSEYLYETEMDGKRSVRSGRVTETFVRQHGRWTNPGWHTDPGPRAQSAQNCAAQ